MANLDSRDMIDRIYEYTSNTYYKVNMYVVFIQICLVILRPSYDHVGIVS